jgi:hypothetical protein
MTSVRSPNERISICKVFADFALPSWHLEGDASSRPCSTVTRPGEKREALRNNCYGAAYSRSVYVVGALLHDARLRRMAGR